MIKLIQKLFRYLITGTIFLLPFVITIGAIIWLGILVVQYLGPNTVVGKWLEQIGLFYGLYYFQPNYQLLSYLIGLLIGLAIIIAVGAFIEITWVDPLIKKVDDFIKKIPIIGPFYETACQLVSTLDKSKFKQMTPVYCRLGSTMVLALLTTLNKTTINGKAYYSAIIPTAPVPFGGAVLMVPEEDVIFPDPSIPVDKLVAYYTSAGMLRIDQDDKQGDSPKQDIQNDANGQNAEETHNA